MMEFCEKRKSVFIGACAVALLSGADQAFFYDSLRVLKQQRESRYFFSRYEALGTLGLVIAFPLGSFIAGSSLLPYPRTLPLLFLLTAGTAFFSFLFLFL